MTKLFLVSTELLNEDLNGFMSICFFRNPDLFECIVTHAVAELRENPTHVIHIEIAGEMNGKEWVDLSFKRLWCGSTYESCVCG